MLAHSRARQNPRANSANLRQRQIRIGFAVFGVCPAHCFRRTRLFGFERCEKPVRNHSRRVEKPIARVGTLIKVETDKRAAGFQSRFYFSQNGFKRQMMQRRNRNDAVEAVAHEIELERVAVDELDVGVRFRAPAQRESFAPTNQRQRLFRSVRRAVGRIRPRRSRFREFGCIAREFAAANTGDNADCGSTFQRAAKRCGRNRL